MLLQDKRRRGDVGEKYAHPESLRQHVIHEPAVSEDRNESSERAPDAALYPSVFQQRFANPQVDGEKQDADYEQRHENAVPVGKVQQESAEYRREDRAQSVDDHQHREKAAQFLAFVQIGRDRFRQYDPACSGDSLEQSEQDERIDVPGEQAGDGRRDEQAERDEDRPFAAVLVADRADQQLAAGEAEHT